MWTINYQRVIFFLYVEGSTIIEKKFVAALCAVLSRKNVLGKKNKMAATSGQFNIRGIPNIAP